MIRRNFTGRFGEYRVASATKDPAARLPSANNDDDAAWYSSVGDTLDLNSSVRSLLDRSLSCSKSFGGLPRLPVLIETSSKGLLFVRLSGLFVNGGTLSKNSSHPPFLFTKFDSIRRELSHFDLSVEQNPVDKKYLSYSKS